MNGVKAEVQESGFEQRYELDTSSEKVLRAISIVEFREKWLPGKALADPQSLSEMSGREICYRLRDDTPPRLESTVTFAIGPNGSGGTSLRIVRELTGAPSSGWLKRPRTATDRSPCSPLNAASLPKITNDWSSPMREAIQLVPMVVEQSSRGAIFRHLVPPAAREDHLSQRGVK